MCTSNSTRRGLRERRIDVEQSIPIVIAVLLLAVGLDATAKSPESESEPWRLSESLDLPAWLTVTGNQRIRYEALDGQFRADRRGDDQILVLRTKLEIDVVQRGVEVVGELMDARQYLADSETPLNTGIVNTFELLQGYAAVGCSNLLQENSKFRISLGRLTMDVGSRRLIARNRFRNTINSFNGVNVSWTAVSGLAARAFYVLPVNRRPSDGERDRLLDNDTEFDEETFDVRFWGVFSRLPEALPGVTGEFYLFGLQENDSQEWPTSNRDLYTVGGRFYHGRAKNELDFELEAVFQMGTSRSSRAAADKIDLDHRAGFFHGQVGRGFDAAWSPHFALQLDYASGDKNPNDAKNNRFDTLYGARRFDFGPTGIYGALARSNLFSPGYKLDLTPSKRLDVMFAHRFCWLAAKKDAWTAGGLRDTSGNSGRYLGSQAEFRFRWDLLPKSIQVEVGAASLFAGTFMDRAPNTNGEGNATYGYVQNVFTF